MFKQPRNYQHPSNINIRDNIKSNDAKRMQAILELVFIFIYTNIVILIHTIKIYIF